MDRIGESLNRVVAAPVHRSLAAPAPKLDADGCLTERQRHTLATILTCWTDGARLAIAVADVANRADPNKVHGALLKKANREICELLDELEDFQPLVEKCIDYAAKLRRYEFAEQRYMDAMDDAIFDAEVKVAALGAGGDDAEAMLKSKCMWANCSCAAFLGDADATPLIRCKRCGHFRGVHENPPLG
jgi:hypothetical protein